MKTRFRSPDSAPLAPSLGIALTVYLAGNALTSSVFATDATWVGGGGNNENWQTLTNWNTNPAIPQNAGDTATFANTISANTIVFLNGAVTLGSLVNLDTNNEINIQNGTGGSITFDTGTTAVPSIDVSARTGGVGLLLYATVNGSNGLIIKGSPTTAIRVNASTNWAGFSGGLTISQGLLAPQAGNYNSSSNAITANTILPTDERLTLGTVGTTGFNLSSGRDLAVGSLAGTSRAGVYNTSTGTSFAVLAVGNDNTKDAVFSGTIGAAADGSNANMLHLHKIGAGTQEIAGKMTGTGNVSVLNGTLILSNSANNNDYTGTTTVLNGTLKIGSANALGATGTASGTTLNGNGILDLNGVTTGESITISNSGNQIINSNAGAAAITADTALNANLTVNTTGDITATRLIGNAIRTVIKTGAGTLTTTGTSHNNLTAWDIQAGTVIFANTSGLGADRGVSINGGTLRLSGSNSNLINDGQSFAINSGTFDLNGKSEAVASVDGNGGTITNGALGSTSTLYVGGGSGGSSSATFGGVIENGSGTINVTKEGSGTQTLNGGNTYTGTTTVRAGTLSIGTSGSLGNTALTVGGNGSTSIPTLAGGGTIGGTTVFASAGTGVAGTHAVGGDVVGTQTFSSSLEYQTGSIFEWDLVAGAQDPGTGAENSGSYDKVVANGASGSFTGNGGIFRILLGGNSFTDAFWATSKSWTDIFSGSGAPTDLSAIFTSFNGAGVASDGTVSGSGQFSVSGSSLTWSAVPEPSSAFAGLLIGAGLLRRRRKN